jgi:hypothetical protein
MNELTVLDCPGAVEMFCAGFYAASVIAGLLWLFRRRKV